MAETKQQMAVQSAQPLTIIDKVQQPINHKQPVVETELTIKMLSQAQHSNKLEARLRENQQEILQVQPVGSKMDHPNQEAPPKAPVLLQSGTTY